ncbi:MAG: FIST C-terminal domain-containing protein [Clostridiales Family XIII bacterium]|jgi:hypothetical protein|nr:FIST C-terminal domain-containing protein [Clostridiales Family XIII bacterium]
MMKMLNAFTTEIDEPEAAVDEILAQLDLKHSLLKNSVAIISCYYEFLETGVVEELCERLPFDAVGCTVIGSAVNAAAGMEQLSIAVLTSDAHEFSTAVSDEISEFRVDEPIADVYRAARDRLSGEPSGIFAFGPIMTDVSGDYILKTLNDVSGGDIPIFGTLSNDTALTYENARTFRNGEIHPRKLALILISGDFNPEFFVTAVSDRNIQQQSAIVTESEGYRLKRVNDMPLLDYLMSIGVDTHGLAAVTTLPFLVDYKDGTKPVACSMYAITEEGAFCGVAIPEGASLTFAEVDYNSVLDTAENAARNALTYAEEHGASFMIAVTCFSRCLVIMPAAEDEMEKTREIIGNDIPLLFIYSGGEICPVYNAQGDRFNRFHNLTYTVAVF